MRGLYIALGLAVLSSSLCFSQPPLIVKDYPSSKESSWGYADKKTSFGAPPLHTESDKYDEIYRLLCWPTWEPALLITIKKNSTTATFETKQTGAMGGYGVTSSVFESKRDLTAREWAEFKRLFDRTKFWTAPKLTKRPILDGTGYTLEALVNSQYREVVRGDVEPKIYPEDVPWENLFNWIIALVPQKGVMETSDGSGLIMRDGSGFYLDSGKAAKASSKSNR